MSPINFMVVISRSPQAIAQRGKTGKAYTYVRTLYIYIYAGDRTGRNKTRTGRAIMINKTRTGTSGSGKSLKGVYKRLN